MVEEKYLVLHIEGGLGKTIMSTALLPSLYKKHPDRKIIVVCYYPEVFMNNPYIHRVYRIHITPYFYDTYIKNKDTLVLKHDPYNDTSYFKQDTHLIDIWAKLWGLEEDKYNKTPELYQNSAQLFESKKWLDISKKPILLLHTHGGPLDDKRPYTWTRDIPPYLLHGIVEKYREQYHIIQICRNKEQVIPGVTPIYEKILFSELVSLVRVSHNFILIDSAIQHIAAAFLRKANVLWIGTSPKVFGYEIHNNIQAQKPPQNYIKHPDSYLVEYSLVGPNFECPYPEDTLIFNPKDLIEKLEL